jgi:putative DNA primase/helicase
VLGGFLARVGWSPEDVYHFVAATAATARDDEVPDRATAARDAAQAMSAGRHTYGLPELHKVFGDAVANCTSKWLDYSGKEDQSGRFTAVASPQRNVRSEISDIEATITQDGLARIFARRFVDQLRYCHQTGAWFQWTGTHWQQDQKQAAFQLVRELGRQHSEGARNRDLKDIRRVSFASGVERFARSDPALAVTMEAWDRDDYLLGTPGGVVDLRTGELRPALPADGITKLTAVGPTRHPDCPRWLSFLEQATGADADAIRFLQQWCGYSLSGDTREHALVFVYGPGGNGKSVFLNVLTGILKDYATTAAMDTFTVAKGDRHTTDLAMLRGARLVTASETEEGRAWAEARIKQMTGWDPITARFMHRDNFTFRPTFKLTIVGNHQPVLRNVDDAARRRFKVVPFTRKPAAPDRQLEEKIRGEWPGILRWMIEGYLDWQANGLSHPQSVSTATAAYFAEQDLFSQWLEEKCDVELDNPYKSATTSELYASWSAYARAAGEDPGTTKSFAPAMSRKGIKPFRSSTACGWSGIRLKSEPRYGNDT